MPTRTLDDRRRQVQPALRAAVAVELVPDFSLLHDDVMDHDRTRRHRPTAWTVFGIGPATLAGDAMLALVTDVLAGCGHPAAGAAVRLLGRAAQELVAGCSSPAGTADARLPAARGRSRLIADPRAVSPPRRGRGCCAEHIRRADQRRRTRRVITAP